MYSTKKRKFEKIKRPVQPLELIYLQLQQLISKIDKLEKKVDILFDKFNKKLSTETEIQYNYYG